MQTIKTGIVVALLLAVSYGAFVALNGPAPDLPEDLAKWADETDLDGLMDVQIPGQQLAGDTNSGRTIPADLESLSVVSIPGVGVPGVSLPQAEVPALLNAPSSSSNSQTFDQNAAKVANQLSHGADGPVVKMPNANLQTSNNTPALKDESTSLVPESFPLASTQSSFGATGSPGATIGNASPKQLSNDFPSIPLPAPGLMVTTGENKTDVGGQPLLPASPRSDSASSNSPSAEAETALEPFPMARDQALKYAAAGKLKEALVLLSKYYDRPEVTHAEHSDLLEMLDSLAREVIYSQRHLLSAAYVATTGETIDSVAAQYKITPELIKNINQLGDAQVLTQGQQLKVLEGPFRSEVDLTRGEITVFLKDMYACRFPISVGADPVPKVGTFEVADKRRDRTYYGTGGKPLDANNPSNPYGGFWIDLGQGNCLHGSAEMATTDLSAAGCISLSPIDASDIYHMLTRGSQVVIRK